MLRPLIKDSLKVWLFNHQMTQNDKKSKSPQISADFFKYPFQSSIYSFHIVVIPLSF